MDTFKTPGAVSWHELTTDDVDAAKRFYGEVFGWVLEEMPIEGEEPYTIIKVGEEAIGGIMAKPPGAAGAPSGWTDYVTVQDVDKTVERFTSLGGHVIVPPTDIPKVGRMAHLRDAEGAEIAVIAYDMEEM